METESPRSPQQQTSSPRPTSLASEAAKEDGANQEAFLEANQESSVGREGDNRKLACWDISNDDRLRLSSIEGKIRQMEENLRQVVEKAERQDKIEEVLPLLERHVSNGGRNNDMESSGDESADDIERLDDRLKDEDDEVASLDQNTFSFLISSRFLSIPFLTGLFVFAVKNGIFYLTLANVVNFRKPFNKLGVPVTTSLPVSIAQFFAYCIAVLTQDDLLTAVILLMQGYDADMRRVFGRNAGGGTSWQWSLTLVISFFDGLFGLMVTFLLIVRAPTVLDVILNFAAVEFVTGLDEAAFVLAKLGLLGLSNKLEAARVEEGTYSTKHQVKFRRIRVMGIFIILSFIISGWAYFTALQAEGRYATKTFIVQFDHNVRPELSAHSGFYTLKTRYSPSPHRRFQYVEEREGKRQGRFEYCQQSRRWTFVLQGDDPCDQSKVLVTSVITGLLDLNQLSDEDWFVILPGKLQALPKQDFYISAGCEIHDDCGGLSRGVCEDNKCRCKDGFYGFRCVHEENATCPQLEIDERFNNEFSSVRQLSMEYTRIPGTLFYDRPAYYNEDSKD